MGEQWPVPGAGAEGGLGEGRGVDAARGHADRRGRAAVAGGSCDRDGRAPEPRLDGGRRLRDAGARGRGRGDAASVTELYDPTIDVILRAEPCGGWRARDERHVFDIEYGDREQAKLRKAGSAEVMFRPTPSCLLSDT